MDLTKTELDQLARNYFGGSKFTPGHQVVTWSILTESEQQALLAEHARKVKMKEAAWNDHVTKAVAAAKLQAPSPQLSTKDMADLLAAFNTAAEIKDVRKAFVKFGETITQQLKTAKAWIDHEKAERETMRRDMELFAARFTALSEQVTEQRGRIDDVVRTSGGAGSASHILALDRHLEELAARIRALETGKPCEP